MKTKTFNISMPEELVKKIDARAKKQFESRSALLRRLVRGYLAEAEDWNGLFAYGRSLGEKIGYKSEEEVAQIVHDFRHGKQ